MQETTLETLKREVAEQKSEKEETGKKIQLIVFRLGSEEYALPINQIKEVVPTPRIAVVPGTSDYIVGVANVRGNLIAIIDLEKRFGLESGINPTTDQTHFTLVVASDEFRIGIQVKEVPNTFTTYDTMINDSGNLTKINEQHAAIIDGLVSVDDRMIILLDIIGMMKADELVQLNQKIGKD